MLITSPLNEGGRDKKRGQADLHNLRYPLDYLAGTLS